MSTSCNRCCRPPSDPASIGRGFGVKGRGPGKSDARYKLIVFHGIRRDTNTKTYGYTFRDLLTNEVLDNSFIGDRGQSIEDATLAARQMVHENTGITIHD